MATRSKKAKVEKLTVKAVEPELTLAQAREMHIADLRKLAHPIAQEQVARRERGSLLVRGVLRTVVAASRGGAAWEGYTGTHGWWITAHVTPEGYVGFVNIAHGVAVATETVLEPELIEALTVPAQKEGVLASGAAAWTAPDAGLGDKEVEAPHGWTQLVLDLRGVVPAIACVAYVCAWGLRTCYSGRRGVPGEQYLDALPDVPLAPPDEWRLTREQLARVRAAGEPILRRMALHLAALLGCEDEVAAALDTARKEAVLFAEAGPGQPRIPTINMEAAMRAAKAYQWQASGYTAVDALRGAVSSITDVAPKALNRAGAGKVAALADVSNVRGLRYWDLLQHLTIRLLERELAPVAQALWDSMAPHVQRSHPQPPINKHHESPATWHLHQRVVAPAMARLAPEVADEILTGLVRVNSLQESEDSFAIYEALYAEGYLTVRVLIHSRTKVAV